MIRNIYQRTILGQLLSLIEIVTFKNEIRQLQCHLVKHIIRYSISSENQPVTFPFKCTYLGINFG